MDMARDASGNLYTAGYFTNQVEFGTSINYSSTSFGIPDIFIQKSNSSGTVQWATKAGGVGSDRALSIALDASGNSYITGFYFGQATFGTITLSAVSGGKDCFIAKLDASGNFVWAVSCGGSLADIGNGISVDPSGNIFVAGQFEGTAIFGSQTFSSMVNPNTNLPSIDIFISKLDNNGNFLWTKHGAAEYTDRALDVVCNNSGEAYICGQFSDTIQFTNTYNNQVMNSIWLMKVDAAGNELWFRRASGTYSIAYSLALDASQNVYMTGDYQGQLAFFGPPINFITDNYTYRVFLAKYSPSGNFIWASSSSSNSDVSSRCVAVDPNNDPYILGEFACTMNDYSDVYGPGTFNNIGYQDLFVTKFNSSGTFQWSRNFGGPGTDQAHGLTVKTVDRPIIAGSFEKRMTWPISALSITSDYIATHYWVSSYVNNGPYCSDPSYGDYDGIRALGFSDGFISEAVDITRQPYDYYQRFGNTCSRPYVSGCIDSAMFTYTCADTGEYCGTGTLVANTWTGSGLQGSYGPLYHFQWTAATNDTFYNKTVTTSGSYSVTMTTLDGCYSTVDTIYADVHPLPAPPWISDDEPINVQHPPHALPITLCNPDSVWLLGGNYGPTDSSAWYAGMGPYGSFITNGDSINVWTSGWYNFTVTNQYGCYRHNRVQVTLDNPQTPWVVKSLIPDTIVRCQGQPVTLLLYDSISNPTGNPNYVLTGHVQHWVAQPTLFISPLSQQLGGVFTAQTSGTYIVTDTIYQTNSCGTYIYIVKDTFYLLVNPNPNATIAVTGPQYLCPGDTALLVATVTSSTSTNTTWTMNPNDSVWALLPGSYSWSVVITDTVTGCSRQVFQNSFLPLKPSPVLTTVPANGIICPNDSALIHCSNGTALNYQWIGPNGVLPWNTQDIWDSVPGFYHCVITDQDGCELTSNTVELEQYNTPYLVALPGNLVCQNQNVTLQVITGDSTAIAWNAPLSGGGTQQVVSQSGTYSCYVTMCGITTLCSIQIIVSQATATISGVGSVCPGDSVWLNANSGMAGYTWSPGNMFVDSVYVTAGTYSLTTTDVNGCTASASFTVNLDTSVVAPVISNDTVCLGSNGTVYANAQGPIDWYDLPAGGNIIGSGSSLIINNVQSDTTVYVWTQDTSGCHSLMSAATVYVDSSSNPPLITSSDTVCTGDTIWLSANTVSNVIYHWSGPNNYTSASQNNFITPADSTDAGTYSVYINGMNCTSTASNITIVVLDPVVPLVSWTDSICEGTTANPYIINADSNIVYTWTGPQNFSATGDSVSIGPATANMSGTYSVTISGACATGSNSYNLTVLAAPGQFTASVGSLVCTYGTICFSASGGTGIVSYEWNGLANGFYSQLQNPTVPADTTMTGQYEVTAYTVYGCASLQPQVVSVYVYPAPEVNIGPDTTVCASPPYVLSAVGNYSSYLWEDNSTNQQHLALMTGMYTLMVTDSNGCRGFDTAYIEVIRCSPQNQNVFTPNGDGVNDLFNLGGENYRSLHCKIFDRWGALIYELTDPLASWDGTYYVNHNPVDEGVYYYIAQVETYDGQFMEVSGFIQLNR